MLLNLTCWTNLFESGGTLSYGSSVLKNPKSTTRCQFNLQFVKLSEPASKASGSFQFFGTHSNDAKQMSWLKWYLELRNPDLLPCSKTIGLIWQVLHPLILLSFAYVFLLTARPKIFMAEAPSLCSQSGSKHSVPTNSVWIAESFPSHSRYSNRLVHDHLDDRSGLAAFPLSCHCVVSQSALDVDCHCTTVNNNNNKQKEIIRGTWR